MADKHELMAKLQAARQTSGQLVAAGSQKAYPEEKESRQTATSNGPHSLKENGFPAIPANPAATALEASSEEQPTGSPTQMITAGEVKKEGEKIIYTTISVPKPYGQKAKLFATLLKVNMVAFTCGALDAYIAQLKEAHKLPPIDL